MDKKNAKVSEEISVREFFDMFKTILQHELLAGEAGLDRIIYEPSLNRPALAITGYYKNFASKRIQLFGAGEMSYLRDLSEERGEEVLKKMVELDIPCMIISRNLEPTESMLVIAEKHKVALIRTKMKSKEFSSEVLVRLGRLFSPRTTVHGTLIDINGIGTLIRGDSGIGKSECALGLIDHGHSLVADDHVNCVKVNDHIIIGRGNDLNRGYMECRGIGIINVAELFGIRRVRVEKSIDIVVTFIEWKPGVIEERTGLEINYFEILGVDIPHFVIPVRPGRDMARLVEVAAMVQALRQMGHDGAKAFNDRLIAHMAKGGKK
ncbi:MAG: HPr(Ser) kinase/phosphatase [Opitutales bacterium]|nr:HPr(Ser) kinase/phosphatase [Opitutales bacterium]